MRQAFEASQTYRQAAHGGPARTRFIVRWRRAIFGGFFAVGAMMALSLLGATPAAAQSFCEQLDQSFGEACPGPGTGGSAGVGGGAQNQVEQRLSFLRCQNVDDPACGGPGGAAADSVSYEGISIFVAAGYQHKDRETTAFEMGFDSNSFGPTFGVDYRIGSDGVIGAALAYSHDDGDFDNSFGDFQADTFTFLFYGSYYPTDQSFIDASVGFAPKKFDTKHLDVFDETTTIKGNTNGFDFTADIGGGYDFHFGAFSVGPRLGLHYKRTELDGFTETGPAGSTMFNFKDQVTESFTGTVGVQASYAISTDFGVVVPQASAEYVRQFLDDRERFTAEEAGGGIGPFNFVTDEPDLNHFNVGAGVVFVLPDGVSPFLSYEAELANYLEQTHTLSAGVRLEF